MTDFGIKTRSGKGRDSAGGAGIVTLEGRYRFDTQLLSFYQKRLLEPGWAGELRPDEFAYIKSQLRQSPSLRRRWSFRPSAKRLSESRIRAVAKKGL
jgi:hypothetical protein